jgi:hypothetical protein
LDKARRKKRKPIAGPHFLNVVKAGQQGPRAEEAGGILETESDCQIRVDLHKNSMSVSYRDLNHQPTP